ncbi:uncharacterized protein LOC142556840 [Primulina tabacum]|uniref:uncharacterized protein LOC142556840 n=1 Tax=Primulina tabacum TaxID=48773 RepID=UPI003F59807A
MIKVGPGQQIRLARDLSTSNQDLIGISPLISEHQLNILPGSHPMKQKKRHFGPEKDKVIDEQVKELLKAGHIREIQFPTWLSNVVLGYHQILLAKNDQDKASFITSGGATYQRLMNKVFEKHLGRNVEVYVDDILGKSKEVANFIIDLEETFATLMHYGIKLNSAKCIFCVKSGKFLGFIVTDRGIEELSLLSGSKKAQQFGWDEKCEQAFQDLKIHLAELPVLVKPEPGEKLPKHKPYQISYPKWFNPRKKKLGKFLWTGRLALLDAEYEAVLAGIRAAREVGASRIILYSDSQLITQQIKGAYEVKDDRMIKYLRLIQAQAETFVDWSIEQIPREENGEADALAKMAASLSEGPLLKCLSEGEVDYVLREIHEGCYAEHLRGISLTRKTMLAGF